MSDKIGVFDAGIGGLSVLNELKTLLPNENFIYYSDSVNFPYSEKDEQEMFNITKSITEYFIRKGCKSIVIANDLVAAKYAKKLQEEYPAVLFVGYEIEMPILDHVAGTIIMVPTWSINDARKKFQNNSFVFFEECSDLVLSIEENQQEKIQGRLEEIFERYLNVPISTIILGCANFTFIKKELLHWMPSARIVDGTRLVAVRLFEELRKKDLLSKATQPGSVNIIDSKDSRFF